MDVGITSYNTPKFIPTSATNFSTFARTALFFLQPNRLSTKTISNGHTRASQPRRLATRVEVDMEKMKGVSEGIEAKDEDKSMRA